MKSNDLLLVGGIALVAYWLLKKSNKNKCSCGCHSQAPVSSSAPTLTGLEISASSVPNADEYAQWELKNNTHQQSYASVQADKALYDSVNSQQRFFANFFSIQTQPYFN